MSSGKAPVRLVCFDALYTLIAPRLPVYVQYAQSFEPYLGSLSPESIKVSFKNALKEVQSERPSYAQGHEAWWGEVIQRTAVGAGASPEDVKKHIAEIVPGLLKRFSSREGYRLYEDAIPTLNRLNELGVKTALVSNTNSRILQALEDLNALPHLDPVLISGDEGIEKPAAELFLRACERAGVQPEQAIHIGDELVCDYIGATKAGLSALLLRRPGPDGEEAHKEEGEDLTGVWTIGSLSDVIEIVNT